MSHTATHDLYEYARLSNQQSFLQSLFIHLKENIDYEILNNKTTANNYLSERLNSVYKNCDKIIYLNSEFYIGITNWSLTHQHDFHQIFLVKNQHNHLEEIDFFQLIPKILKQWNHQSDKNLIFLSRVQKSIEESHSILKDKWPEFQKLFNKIEIPFETSEGLLPFGHYAHPYPKLQEKIDPNIDYNFQCPVEVLWCLVDKSILVMEQTISKNQSSLIKELETLFLSENPNNNFIIANNFIPFPIHTYQWEILKNDKNNDVLNNHLIDKKIIISHRSTWYPTTSTRAVYKPTTKWMLKFSLSLRITNSTRVLQPEEVRRGMQLSDVLQTQKGQELKKQLQDNNFKIIEEPMFMALKNNKDELIKESIVVFRENPFVAKDTAQFSLATLNQIHPITQKSLLSSYLHNLNTPVELWFESYLLKVLKPIIILQAKFGIYLGAHQQNIIITLENDGMITGAYYRDCQGTGYNENVYQEYALTDRASTNSLKNVIREDFANNLITYYFFVNASLGTIKSLSKGNQKQEAQLIKRTSFFLQNLKEEFVQIKSQTEAKVDLSLIDKILNAEELSIKNNFICCLLNINENTIENPLSIYQEIKNPFKTNIDIIISEKICLPRFNASLQEVHWNQFQIWTDSRKKYHYVTDVNLQKTFCFLDLEDFESFDLICIQEALFNISPSIKSIVLFSKKTFKKKTITRNDFFQTEGLWENDLSKTLPSKYVTNEKDIRPKRPEYTAGTLLYRRYVHQLKTFLSIRVVDVKKDLDIFFQWHHQPRVANFWELNRPKNELQDYLENALNDPHQIPVIVEFDGEAVGYFEIYWTFEDRLAPFYDAKIFDRGIHLLIGNTKYLGKENTDAILKSVCHYIFLADPRTERIMGEPRIDNDKILKYLLLFDAWKKIKEFDFPHKRAALVECSRERFFQGEYL